MLAFENDYSEGCHPRILEAFARTNLQSEPGYGTDRFCAEATERIRRACAVPEADVVFLTGGTQTNQVVLDALLKPWEGVVAAETGHVAVHEAGAIEATGHKVLTLPQHNGKLDAGELEAFLAAFWADENHEHMVFPGAVYVSHPTEVGTLYSRAELEALSAVCRAREIPLYLDGARLGYGLAAPGTDVTLPDVARLCDAFYIGGTKVGALCGEAVVFPAGAPAHFTTQVKSHGALVAKGRLLGVQFAELFSPAERGADGAGDSLCAAEDTLYWALGAHAIQMAERLRAVLAAHGCTFFLDSPTNQQFVVLGNDAYERLRERVRVSFWERVGESHTAVRFATSWATRSEDIEALDAALGEVLNK